MKLKIDLTINDIASQDFAGLGPSWSKKTLKDVVVVRDQQAVVLGGLISDKITNSESKVPLLGDIPILGYLFKFSQKRKEKRNLLIVLTPYIVHNHTDLERIVERRVREQREFMRTFSTFREITYRPELDYGRKRGLISEINRLVIEQERNARVLEELEQKDVGFPDGPVEYLDARPASEEPPAGPEGDGTERSKEGDVDSTDTSAGAQGDEEPDVEETIGADGEPKVVVAPAPAKKPKKKRGKKRGKRAGARAVGTVATGARTPKAPTAGAKAAAKAPSGAGGAGAPDAVKAPAKVK